MKIIHVKNYEEMSKVGAEIFKEEIIKNPKLTLGLATGSTPVGLYKELIKYYEDGELDFSNIQSINLDEYVGLPGTDIQSYKYFMKENLFDSINIKEENYFLPNGIATDLKLECERYNKLIEELPNRIQLLGIGSNGHVGFNEPANEFANGTNVVGLTESTIKDNADKYFDGDTTLIPKEALSMGTDQIMNAEKIVLLASGKNKAEAIFAALCKEVSPNCPASIIQNHKDVIVIIDEEAGALLDK